MMFTLEWLASFLQEFTGQLKNRSIDHVYTDSRLEKQNGLFIPIIGENFDGHDFAEQAIDNGATAILWDTTKKLPANIPSTFPVFKVDNTINALQQIAFHYRHEVNPTVIGITGSNGKTSTKDIVAAVMNRKYRTHFTDGNLNNHIGLPLTILTMPTNTEVLVLEMGMNNFGEIQTLSEIANPDYAVITNIGESHIEFLGSREGIAKAKLEITSGLAEEGQLIVDGDEALLQHVHHKRNVQTCGFHKNNQKRISSVQLKHQQTIFKLNDEPYTIPFLGEHHAKNAAFAILLGELLHIEKEEIQTAFSNMEKTAMRFEWITGRNEATLINDAYNASPTSMKAAIRVVKQLAHFQEKILVLGDVLELGEQSESYHCSIAEEITKPITKVFTFGNDAKYITEALKAKQMTDEILAMHYTSQDALVTDLNPYLNQNTVILFKASRGLRLEAIINQLIEY
ncbi:UDP-N-acetylmuramoyl-tripeptide--D-alanyl-D-alanine ligase [Virgibacillus massiliensis]|nr:UDP-N-acetylmuramoyl-tripeptide--D-alanyl-D-alanine ligase [Virgibacillus massiliensis]MYL42345.1 UDP-N-acetylmuramoyl-tripeptide--D-alanyl-D-alanine ligase [Virgibacillus massiliensis]